MFHNEELHNKESLNKLPPKQKSRSGFHSGKKQRGFLMPVAIFILVVMAGFAAALNRMTAQTAIMVPQEMISTAAFYAAETGAQLALNQMFYSVATTVTRADADAACVALATPLTFPATASGLVSCSVALSCAISNDAGNTTSFYSISSAASCGSGDVSAQRTIDVSSFIQ